ncbi:MAG: hypothetical protein JSR80_05040 [Verrucomicrobia bacterium]|nr:hypothetical protein [Verrucomicrobiota bacterium]
MIGFGTAYSFKKLNRKFSLMGAMASSSAALAFGLVPKRSTSHGQPVQIKQKFEALGAEMLKYLPTGDQQIVMVASWKDQENNECGKTYHSSSGGAAKAIEEVITKISKLLPASAEDISSVHLRIAYQAQEGKWKGWKGFDEFNGFGKFQALGVCITAAQEHETNHNAPFIQSYVFLSELIEKVEAPEEEMSKSAIALAINVKGEWKIVKEKSAQMDELIRQWTELFSLEGGAPQVVCGITFEGDGKSLQRFSSNREGEIPEEVRKKLSGELNKLNAPVDIQALRYASRLQMRGLWVVNELEVLTHPGKVACAMSIQVGNQQPQTRSLLLRAIEVRSEQIDKLAKSVAGLFLEEEEVALASCMGFYNEKGVFEPYSFVYGSMDTEDLKIIVKNKLDEN